MRQLWAQGTAWAIDTRSDEGHGFIGRFWFHKGAIPAHFGGYRTAVFNTRREARTALQKVKPKEGYRAFPRAIVVRVRVVVEAVASRSPEREQSGG